MLRLREAVVPGRRRPPSGFRRARRHADLTSHSGNVRKEIEQVKVRYQARPAVLGIDPKLILVVNLGAPVADDEFRRSGLRVLDSSDKSVVIAFADDPQLAGFLERLDACAAGAPPGRASEPYADFVDAINSVRALGAADRVSEELAIALQQEDPGAELRLDVELWHPDDRLLVEQWVDMFRTAVQEANARVTDLYISNQAGVILARVYVPAGRVWELADLDVIARLQLLPRPELTIPQLYRLDVGDLPEVHPPAQNAPVVALIDSGVASAHPLIGPAVLAAEALSPLINDGEDRHGHGTMVAGLLLHGPIAPVVTRGLPTRPICKLVSVAVLDENNRFPDEHRWERDLVEALEWCASQGAKIVNLSLGDARHPLQGPRQFPAAALVDEAARRLRLVVVVSAGNSHPADYLATLDPESVTRYPTALLSDEGTGLIDPATAALALTVGGVTDAMAAGAFLGRETVTRRPFGRPGWPSPLTRRGAGIGGSVKPELVERAGTFALESGAIVQDAELKVVSSLLRPGQLLGTDIGTSFAAPLVSRVAAAVQSRYPSFGPNLVRALVLLSAEASNFEDVLEGSRAAKRNAALQLLGYGRPSVLRASESTRHRVVLVAEAELAINGVHIYEVPVPGSFFDSGGQRGIDISLAFDPRTRQSRLDYLSSKLEFLLYRGRSLEDVAALVATVEGEDVDLEAPAEREELGQDKEDSETDHRVASGVVRLEPPNKVRSRGANQLGRKRFSHRWDRQRDTPMYLVVRNVNRWDIEGANQDYGLAVALWRTEDRAELFAELEAQLEAVLEMPIEVEVQIES